MDRERLPLGGGIFGKSPRVAVGFGVFKVGALSRLLPRRFEINFVGDGGRKPREDLTCVIKLLAM